MKSHVDCQIFQDQLEGLVHGTLPEEGRRQLRVHADACPQCALLLTTQEHLTNPTLAELEEAVPQDLLDSVWPRVEAETGSVGKPSGREKGPATRRGLAPRPWLLPTRPWVLPTLAAASLVLLISTGFLATELMATRARAQRLASQVQALDLLREALDGGQNLAERTARLGERGTPRRRTLEYALMGRGQVSLSELTDLLQELPEDEILFEASRLEIIQGLPRSPSPESREILNLLESVVPDGGRLKEVRAGDLIRWLRASDLPGSTVLPKSSIKDLLS